MKLRLQLVVESETGDVVTTQDVAQLQRHSFKPEEVGLTLAEAKQLLGSVQQVMVQEQLTEYIAEQTHCRECGQTLARKGQHEIVFRTPFGLRRLRKLTLLSLNRVTHTQNRIQKALRQLVIIRAAGACC
jgi:hypothetical protein